MKTQVSGGTAPCVHS